jgi:hypothetical protein
VSAQDVSGTPEDRAEQDTPIVREPAADVQVPLEAVDADVVEQAADVRPSEPPASAELPLEADPADAAEQSAVVELDEDERR